MATLRRLPKISLVALILITLFLVIFLDQGLKVWVKTHMVIGEEKFLLGEWFRLHFTENPGMAFGRQIGGPYGKLLLSLIRIIAIILLIAGIRFLIRKEAPRGLLVCAVLVLAGAIGNMIDSAFYGMLFSGSFHRVATFLPENGGYAGFLTGNVVDMFFLPVYSGYIPEWVPFWGGRYVMFFRSIFNVADIAISAGILTALFRYSRFFLKV